MMPQFNWRSLATLLVFGAVFSSIQVGVVVADVKRVTVDVADPEVWVGEKASFFVKLRGQGPFVGAASFSIPEIPRAIIVKVGNPVVSSEEIEGDSWFVQSHEFVLFSQQDGALEVSQMEVRFTDRDGYTGPEQAHREQVPDFELQVNRPDQSDPNSFLVTTESLTIKETWEPQPGKAQQGAVFYRTISQQGEEISGMALAPPSTTAPDGVRVHVGNPEVKDNTERGEFTGRRVDRLTYVMERPGLMTMPALQYVWWNPKTEQYGSTTLPSVVFEIEAMTVNADAADRSTSHARIGWLLFGLVIIVACGWQRHRLYQGWVDLWQTINPPERRAARMLRRACRHNDVRAAETAWNQWFQLQPSGFQCPPELRSAVIELQRQHYGPVVRDASDRADSDHQSWDGASLAKALARWEAKEKHSPLDHDLPPINPTEPIST